MEKFQKPKDLKDGFEVINREDYLRLFRSESSDEPEEEPLAFEEQPEQEQVPEESLLTFEDAQPIMLEEDDDDEDDDGFRLEWSSGDEGASSLIIINEDAREEDIAIDSSSFPEIVGPGRTLPFDLEIRRDLFLQQDEDDDEDDDDGDF
jgi:hypothetical protein